MVRMSFYLLLIVLVSGCSSDQKSQDVWIAGWKETSSLNVPRAGAATVISGNVIYVLGGVDGRDFLTSTEYAKILPDGRLSEWRMGPELPTARGFTSAVVHDGYIYVVGGGNGPNGQHLLRSTERAKISADGELSEWVTEASKTVLPRRCTKLGLIDNRVYSFGGYGGVLLDSVEFSPINGNGNLGEWAMTSESMTLPRYVNSVKIVGGRAYVIGGHDQSMGVGITDVEWTAPDGAGDMSTWKKTAALQIGRYGLASTAKQGRIYVFGGLTGLEYLSSVEMADVLAEGGLSAWRLTTALTRPRATFGVVSSKHNVYVLGGTNSDGYLRSVEFTGVNAQGDLGYWGTKQDKQDYDARLLAESTPKQTLLPKEGIVKQVLHTQMYSYIQILSPDGLVWLAGPRTELAVNTRIRHSKGVYMSNFYSKELQRKFPAVTFVSRIEIEQ